MERRIRERVVGLAKLATLKSEIPERKQEREGREGGERCSCCM